MRYVGGKGRISKAIATTILSMTTERDTYIEPFVGGAAVFEQVAPHFETAMASDLEPNVVALWQGLHDDTFIPPESVTEAQYARLRDAPPSAIRGLVGFGGSFGGKFFGGYARGGFNGETPRNHYGESARSAIKTAEALRGLEVGFFHLDYTELAPLRGDVVYCDPPYAATQGYSTGAFDSALFWDTMAAWSSSGARVFVSEYEAPAGWSTVWEAPIRQSLTMPSQGRAVTVERLFTVSDA